MVLFAGNFIQSQGFRLTECEQMMYGVVALISLLFLSCIEWTQLRNYFQVNMDHHLDQYGHQFAALGLKEVS